MRRARLAFLVPVALLGALLLASPTGVLAADTVTVTGTVVRDGQPVTGVAVTIGVSGSDLIGSAVTDESGAFAIDVELAVGAELRVTAMGQTSRSDPDARGCVHSETPTGSITVTVDTLPPPAVVVPMDGLITSTICSATAAPRVTPRVTPPATDGLAGSPVRGGPDGGLVLVLGALAVTSAGSVALASRRG